MQHRSVDLHLREEGAGDPFIPSQEPEGNEKQQSSSQNPTYAVLGSPQPSYALWKCSWLVWTENRQLELPWPCARRDPRPCPGLGLATSSAQLLPRAQGSSSSSRYNLCLHSCSRGLSPFRSVTAAPAAKGRFAAFLSDMTPSPPPMTSTWLLEDCSHQPKTECFFFL